MRGDRADVANRTPTQASPNCLIEITRPAAQNQQYNADDSPV
ncbi:MAG: hypothetical protein ACI9SE_003181, partial [Neolewinella sp.]